MKTLEFDIQAILPSKKVCKKLNNSLSIKKISYSMIHIKHCKVNSIEVIAKTVSKRFQNYFLLAMHYVIYIKVSKGDLNQNQ